MNLKPEATGREMRKVRVLFLCGENACRSQMAEGLLRAKAPEAFEASSAGTVATSVHPMAVTVMAEIDIDISTQRSKPVSEFEGREFDHVITVCGGGAACPAFIGVATGRETWDFRDPAAAEGGDPQVIEVFREARDEISKRVDRFIEEKSGL